MMGGFLSIILARKNSKRLKKKNVKFLLNKPLISWTFDFINKLFKTDNVLVSTDDNQIIKIAEKYKFKFILKRPKKLCTSKAKSIDAIVHALDFLKKKGLVYKNFILFQPTSPIRNKKTLLKMIKIFKKKNLETIISVSRGWKDNNSFYLSCNGSLTKIRKKNSIKVRINGNIYIAKTDYIIKNKSFLGERCKGYLLNDKIESTDIDTMGDWEQLTKKIKFLK